jgi:hypothetical protein
VSAPPGDGTTNSTLGSSLTSDMGVMSSISSTLGMMITSSVRELSGSGEATTTNPRLRVGVDEDDDDEGEEALSPKSPVDCRLPPLLLLRSLLLLVSSLTYSGLDARQDLRGYPQDES